MSGQPGGRGSAPIALLLVVLLLVLGAATMLTGVWLVGGLGWTLLVGGAVLVALALVVLPT